PGQCTKPGVDPMGPAQYTPWAERHAVPGGYDDRGAPPLSRKPGTPSPVEGRLIDAHSLMLASTVPNELMFNHAVMCQVGLPYRNPGDDVRLWARSNGRASLQLEAGHALAVPGSTEWSPVGLPYGPRARLVLIQLSTYALQRQTPIIEVEDSMTAFARSIGLATSGRNLNTLRDQLSRLAACSLRIGYGDAEQSRTGHIALFSEAQVWFPKHPGQRVLWPSMLRFSTEYYESLRENAVPLDPRAIASLKHSCRCLDIYTWLANRLLRVNGTQAIRWRGLRLQFAPKRMHMGTFRRHFAAALKQVLMVYPAAKVEMDDKGLLLRSSKPPVPGWRRGLRGGWDEQPGVAKAS
ncbi:hypothetical protein LCGC14_2916110, partial [marine sediment metagenome]